MYDFPSPHPRSATCNRNIYVASIHVATAPPRDLKVAATKTGRSKPHPRCATCNRNIYVASNHVATAPPRDLKVAATKKSVKSASSAVKNWPGVEDWMLSIFLPRCLKNPVKSAESVKSAVPQPVHFNQFVTFQLQPARTPRHRSVSNRQNIRNNL